MASINAENVQTSSTDWRSASTLGAIRGLLRTPLEQPFDTVKTRWQAVPSAYANARSVWQYIYRIEGWKAFYRGSLPNTVKFVTRETYRYCFTIGVTSCIC